MRLRLPSLTTTPQSREEKVAELTEHLGELRTRIMRSCAYCGIGMILMYVFRDPVSQFLSHPIDAAIHQLATTRPSSALPAGSFAYHSFTDPFFLVLQVTMIGGLIVGLPFVIMELWGFVAPALTPDELRAVRFVGPMSIVLFIMGLGCAYFVLPMAVRWFLSFLPPDATLLQNPLTYIVFVIKLMLAFGLVFQLPVALMFLGKVGIISSALMKKYWRQISVGLFTLAMVVAPSNDPGTMLALAIPLTILFFGSIWLVQWVEPKPAA